MSLQWLATGLALLSLALRAGGAWLARPPNRFAGPGLPPLASQAARFFYFVGLPYLAVVAGLLTPRLLGLKGLEYFGLIQPAGASAASLGAELRRAAALMLAEWLLDSGVIIIAGLAALVLFKAVLAHLARHGLTSRAGLTDSLADTLYQSFHWTFYRALFWVATGDLYLGVVLGSAFVLLEWAVTSRLQGSRALPPLLWLKAMILILTATIFFFSPNWWLLLPVHLVMVFMVKRSLPARRGASRYRRLKPQL